MSRIVNPGPAPVPVARWIVDPNSSKARHSLTGEVVDQLPEKVANLSIVHALVDQGVLVDADAPKKTPVVRAPVREAPVEVAVAAEVPAPEPKVTITAKAKKEK